MKISEVLGALLMSAILLPASAHATPAGAVATHLPDFAGRDKRYAYMRAKILQALKASPNFAGHYTIVTTGCGTGCTSNLIVDRETGKVSEVPYGGEMQQLLTLRYRLASNVLFATWFDDDLCVKQLARWNGASFEILSQPKGQPDAVCQS